MYYLRLPCCILKFISYCQNTNKSDNCSMQDSRPRPRHITARLGNAVLYGISDRLLHRLEMVQCSAARVVLRLRRGDRRSMTAALKQLHWLPVKLITPYVPRRALRSADRALLVVPRHNLERYGRRSFSRAGPTLWNAPPEDLRSTVCMNKFKTHLKTYYFKIAFNV